MIVASIAAALSLFGPPAPQPSLAASPAPPMYAPERAVREVVYAFTYDESDEWTREVFGSPPDSETQLSGYSGTLTVDESKPDADGDLHLTITEVTDAANGKKPFVYNAILSRAGKLDFGDASSTRQSDEPIELYLLLPYLATSRFGDHSLQSGSSWRDDTFLDFTGLDAAYTVSAAENGLATVHIVTKPAGDTTATTTLDENVSYDAGLGVAGALDVYASVLNNGAYGTDAHLHYHFKLASDTALQGGGLR